MGVLSLSSFLDTIYVWFIWKNIRTVFRGDIFANFRQGVIADPHRIGTHVGNESGVARGSQLFAFVQLLRDLHGPLHGVLEAVVGGALECGRDEWRGG